MEMEEYRIFKDRKAGGEALAAKLSEYKDSKCLVLAIPRGGVITAYEVANYLGAELDLVVTRKLALPSDPETAIGAVDADGSVTIDKDVLDHSYISAEELKNLKDSEKKEIKRRLQIYRRDTKFPSLKDKTVIIVDDGIATGYTALSAIGYVKKRHPKKLILAIPIAPESVVNRLRKKADVTVLETPSPFLAIGRFYRDFPPVSDETVIETMRKAKANVKIR
jgi:predicted phosphoribosyltransferase